MKEKRWILNVLNGFIIVIAITNGLKTTRPKFKIASSTTTSTTVETTSIASSPITEQLNGTKITTISSDANVTSGHILTGIPQIDYIWDPNLPRELNGFNLSDYPFYASMPEDIDFKCDGLHDGFYASVPHKCQVYHHCLFGTRYDFLCANFTAFDQKTFICHFVSEVDCVNSKNYWHRNDALYKTTTTTTTTTTASTTSTSTAIIPSNNDKAERGLHRNREKPMRRRRPLIRRPAYDYYDDYYVEDDYERLRSRVYNRREYDDYEDKKYRRNRNRETDFRHRDFPNRDRDRFLVRANRRDSTRNRDSTNDDRLKLKVKIQDSSELKNSDIRNKHIPSGKHNEERIKDAENDKDLVLPKNNNPVLHKQISSQGSIPNRFRISPINRKPLQLTEEEKYSHIFTTSSYSESQDSIPSDDAEEYSRFLITKNAGVQNQKPLTTISNTEHKKLVPSTNDDDDDYYYDYEVVDIRPSSSVRNKSLKDKELPDKQYSDRLFRSRPDSNEEMDLHKSLKQLRNQNSKRQHSHKSIQNEPFGKNVDKVHSLNTKLNEDPKVTDNQNFSTFNNFNTERHTTTKTQNIDDPFSIIPFEKNDKRENITHIDIKRDMQNQQSRKNTSHLHSLLKEKQVLNKFQSTPAFGLNDHSHDTDKLIANDSFINLPLQFSQKLKVPFLPSRGGKSNSRGISFIGLKTVNVNLEEIFPEPKNMILQHDVIKQDTFTTVTNNIKSISNTKYKEKYDILGRQQINQPKVILKNSNAYEVQEIYNKNAVENNQHVLKNNSELLQQDSLTVFNPSKNIPYNQQNLSINKDIKISQQINEVVHDNGQDIPKSEYDVILNEALLTNSNKEPHFINEFTVPLHGRYSPSLEHDILQSSKQL